MGMDNTSVLTNLSTPDLIRALGGAEAICRPGCTCRGTYSGPERRSNPHSRQTWTANERGRVVRDLSAER